MTGDFHPSSGLLEGVVVVLRIHQQRAGQIAQTRKRQRQGGASQGHKWDCTEMSACTIRVGPGSRGRQRAC